MADREDERDEETEDELWNNGREESQVERNEPSDDDLSWLKERRSSRQSDDIQDIIDALRQIDQESSD